MVEYNIYFDKYLILLFNDLILFILDHGKLVSSILFIFNIVSVINSNFFIKCNIYFDKYLILLFNDPILFILDHGKLVSSI